MPRGALAQRHDDQRGFVLHAIPYRETSLIVEAFTAEHGRVAMVARGAKRPRSESRGLLQSFQPLILSWAGAGELKTLIKVEWQGGMPLPGGSALLCGFYLNELLLKMLAREDAHPQLFADYEEALYALAELSLPVAQAAVLRRFELHLLAELGYALPLTHDVDTRDAIEPARSYQYLVDRGPRRIAGNAVHEPTVGIPVVRGATLLALAAEVFTDQETAAEAKHLMRAVLDHHLEQRRIFSRRVVQDLLALDVET